MQMGFLGVGMSKAEAAEHFNAAYKSLLNAQSMIAQYPKSAARVGAPANFTNLANGFAATWKAAGDASPGVTIWGNYADKADQFKGYFDALVGQVMSARDQLGEKAAVDKADIPKLDIPGLDTPTEIPWVPIIAVLAVGAVLWGVTSRSR